MRSDNDWCREYLASGECVRWHSEISRASGFDWDGLLVLVVVFGGLWALSKFIEQISGR